MKPRQIQPHKQHYLYHLPCCGPRTVAALGKIRHPPPPPLHTHTHTHTHTRTHCATTVPKYHADTCVSFCDLRVSEVKWFQVKVKVIRENYSVFFAGLKLLKMNYRWVICSLVKMNWILYNNLMCGCPLISIWEAKTLYNCVKIFRRTHTSVFISLLPVISSLPLRSEAAM